MAGQFGLRFRLPRKSQGSFTYCKSATWDRRLYFTCCGIFRPKASAGFELEYGILRHQIKVTVQLHAPASVSLGHTTSSHRVWGWVDPRSAWGDWRTQILVRTGNPTQDRPSSSAVGKPTALFGLRLKKVALLMCPVMVGLLHRWRTALGTKYTNPNHLCLIS
jgi:hypothetical protein